jgi:outer membrane receptor protein involved in Fe transport
LLKFDLRDSYDEYAGFGDLTFHFTDRLALTTGARYSHNQQDFAEAQSGFLYPTFNKSRSTQDDSWTWLVNPQFKVTPDLMVYGRVATGYRPGGPTVFVPIGSETLSPTFQPDTLTSYELGVKSQLLGRHLTLEADVFDIDWHKIQLNEDVEGFQYITNGGNARSRGVEATASFTPLRGLQMTGAATFTQAELTQNFPLAGGLDGDRLPGVPRWNESVDVSYTRTVAPAWDGFAGASFRHVGDRLTDFGLLPTGAPGERFSMGQYNVTDVRTGVSHNHITFTFYVKNVADSRGVVALGPNTYPLAGYSYQAAIIQPRTFGVDLSCSF